MAKGLPGPKSPGSPQGQTPELLERAARCGAMQGRSLHLLRFGPRARRAAPSDAARARGRLVQRSNHLAITSRSPRRPVTVSDSRPVKRLHCVDVQKGRLLQREFDEHR